MDECRSSSHEEKKVQVSQSGKEFRCSSWNNRHHGIPAVEIPKRPGNSCNRWCICAKDYCSEYAMNMWRDPNFWRETCAPWCSGKSALKKSWSKGLSINCDQVVMVTYHVWTVTKSSWISSAFLWVEHSSNFAASDKKMILTNETIVDDVLIRQIDNNSIFEQCPIGKFGKRKKFDSCLGSQKQTRRVNQG